MKTINDLFDLFKQSDVTLVGYTFKDERIKDELISNFNYVDVGQIDSSFSLKSFLRDSKLNSILDDKFKLPDYILIDTNNILYDSENIGSRRNSIRSITEKIRSEIYSQYSGNFPQTPLVKLIITQPMNVIMQNLHRTFDDDTTSFTGGNSTLYISDLVVTIKGDKIKVVKNRFGDDDDDYEIVYNPKQTQVH